MDDKKITEIVLTQKQKQYLLDNLFEDEELHNFYNNKLNTNWTITNDETKDTIYDYRNEEFYSKGKKYPYPYVLIIDNEFTDALGKNFTNKILEIQGE